MQEDLASIGEPLKPVVEMSQNELVSEEDVKNKVALPLLRSLGYEDTDFGYERRTGRGYADVVVDDCLSVIVVETKAPRTRIDNYRAQLENYVFLTSTNGIKQRLQY
jgi:hypothetical protein